MGIVYNHAGQLLKAKKKGYEIYLLYIIQREDCKKFELAEDIDPELLERERAIFLAQANDSGKDASIMEKMVEGKVKRFLSEVTLLSQGFVKDPDKSIEDLLNDNNASIISFARFKVGEGIEIEVKDFASEVAEQLQQ